MILKFGFSIVMAFILACSMGWSEDDDAAAAPPEDWPSYMSTDKFATFCANYKDRNSCDNVWATEDGTAKGKQIKTVSPNLTPNAPWKQICSWNDIIDSCEPDCNVLSHSEYYSKSGTAKKFNALNNQIMAAILKKAATVCPNVKAKRGGKMVPICEFNAKQTVSCNPKTNKKS